MDKVEAYLDRVCRGIAGPRSLRAHVRQELREHLRDAAAEHVAAGMSEEEAMIRALEEFGGPDDVRAELEAEHGHRWMTVVIDQAMAWKEKTMKARWIWLTWMHVALVLVIVMDVLVMLGAIVLVWPRFRELASLHQMRAGPNTVGVLDWGVNSLANVAWAFDQWVYLVIIAALAWLMFERVVKNENKALIRLALLGSAAVGLTIAMAWTGAALVLPLVVDIPAGTMRLPDQVVLDDQSRMDLDLKELESALAAKDQSRIRQELKRAQMRTEYWVHTLKAASEIVPPSEGTGLEKSLLRWEAVRDLLKRAQDAANRLEWNNVSALYPQIRAAHETARGEPATQPAK